MVTDGMQDRENCAAMAECSCGCGVHEKKERDAAEKKSLITRLKRIEGQIRGLERMIDEDAYCPDILTQSMAAAAALNSFNREVLSTHIKTCVMNDVRNGNDASVEELVKLLQKMMR